MKHAASRLMVVVIVTAGCATAPPEQQFVNEIAAALGGRERVLAVRTVVAEGEGTQYNLGQDVRPGATGQTFVVSGLRQARDIPSARMRTELTRTPNFAFFQGQQPQRQVQGLDGEVAYNIAANGNATRVAADGTLDRRADFYHHPVVIVRAALAPGATITNVRAEGTGRLADITTDNGLRFVLAVDGSNLPTRVESKRYHPNLGDITVSTHFADYSDAGGLRLPTRVTTKVDDFTTTELRFTKQTIDGDVGDLAAPSVVTAAAPPVAAPPTVVPQEVAPGVWLLAGQSHHSALIEFSDHLMLIDAPQSEARTLAVIAKARELRPSKPLTQVVTTHHHFDHTAGIRAAIAEGLTVITHSGNRTFFEEMAKRPHTITSDALAKNPRPVKVDTVDDELVIRDELTTVVLYHIAGNPHSDTMLMTYIPGARVLVQVDAFSPGGSVNPYATNLLANITKRNLAVDRIVPLHGAIVPFSELTKVVAVPTN